MVSLLYTFYTALAFFQCVFSHPSHHNALASQILRRTTIPQTELDLSKRDFLNYETHIIPVPIDHFHNESRYEPHSDDVFQLRYWFDATFYKPGGPVIILQAGETNAEGRLKYLEAGVMHDLISATNGIGVVLEHRYYGSSVPTSDFSTSNLRFLTTEQSLMDEVYFARNVVFPGFEDKNLTAPNVAYIGYGGSYAGSLSAFLRKLYPDTFWGAISSSGVPEAIVDYWQFFEPIRTYADPKCTKTTQLITNSLDNIVIGQKNNPALVQELKTTWGFPNITHSDDFMQLVAFGIQQWQNKNWDPELMGKPHFDNYCRDITSNKLHYPNLKSSTAQVQNLLRKGGYGSQLDRLTIPYLNWIGWLNEFTQTYYKNCSPDQDTCYSTHNLDFYAHDDLSQTWRLWSYQVCTEWGYFQTGAGTPSRQLPLISRTIDVAYLSIICKAAFGITTPPEVERINKYGGFSLSYPRLANVDGEQDAWRPAGVHASPFNPKAENRTSTISEPFILIKGAVHHWDENGVAEYMVTPDFPPQTIKDVQKQEVEFVKAWMVDWEKEVGSKGKAMI